MTSVSHIDVDIHDLTCPISLQVFRDPVIAGDGHVYERAAITRWINENGTSPFTREPLNVDELNADDHLRYLASQRRCSTVSYHRADESVFLPPISEFPLAQTDPPNTSMRRDHNLSSPKNSSKRICLILIFFILLPAMVVIIPILITTQGSSSPDLSTWPSTASTPIYGQSTPSPSEDTHLFSGTLTSLSDTYLCPGCSGATYYYQNFIVNDLGTAFYQIDINADFSAYVFIYANNFYPSDPYQNLIAQNNGQSMSFFSESNQIYIFVVTTQQEYASGRFSLDISPV